MQKEYSYIIITNNLPMLSGCPILKLCAVNMCWKRDFLLPMNFSEQNKHALENLVSSRSCC